MTNEDFQRRKTLLHIRQAQSEARLRKLEGTLTRFEEESRRRGTIFEEKMTELRKAQARTDRQMKLLNKNIGKDDKGKSQQ